MEFMFGDLFHKNGDIGGLMLFTGMGGFRE